MRDEFRADLAEVSRTLVTMAEGVRIALRRATSALLTANRDEAEEVVDRDDDVMDDLHRQLFKIVLGSDWPHGVEAAVDGALLGRFYERYADHAVNVGRRVVFLVTGENLGASPLTV